MVFSLSRCKKSQPKQSKAKPKATKKTATTKVRSEDANNSKAIPRKKRTSTKKRPPIPSFRSNKYLELDRLERDFLGEKTDEDDSSSASSAIDFNDGMTSEGKASKKKKQRLLPTPPIPSFRFESEGGEGLLSSDDDNENDSFLLSLSVFQKDKKRKATKKPTSKPSRRPTRPHTQPVTLPSEEGVSTGCQKSVALAASQPTKLDAVAEGEPDDDQDGTGVLPQEIETTPDNDSHDDFAACHVDDDDDNVAIFDMDDDAGVNDVQKENQGALSNAANNNHAAAQLARIIDPSPSVEKDAERPPPASCNDPTRPINTKDNTQVVEQERPVSEKPPKKAVTATTSRSTKSDAGDANLFMELDLLFVASDEGDVSIKSFYQQLEQRIGKKLSKRTKKKVRARLTELVNGDVQPMTTNNRQHSNNTNGIREVSAEECSLALVVESTTNALPPIPEDASVSEVAAASTTRQMSEEIDLRGSDGTSKHSATDQAQAGQAASDSLHADNEAVSSSKRPLTTKMTDARERGASNQLSQDTSLVLDAMLQLGSPDLKYHKAADFVTGDQGKDVTGLVGNEPSQSIEFEPPESLDGEEMAIETSWPAGETTCAARENAHDVPRQKRSGQIADSEKSSDSKQSAALAEEDCMIMTSVAPQEEMTKHSPKRKRPAANKQDSATGMAGTGPQQARPNQSEEATKSNEQQDPVTPADEDCMIIEPSVVQQETTTKKAPRRERPRKKDKDNGTETASMAEDTTHPETASAKSSDIPQEAEKTKKPTKRGRPRKVNRDGAIDNAKDVISTSLTSSTNNATNTESTKSKPRKQARKKRACALCTTCPCQKAQHDDGSMDLTTLSRSDAAMEKALIRRLQKLEKSSEDLEERLFGTKRRLKVHRREVMKKKQKKLQKKKESMSRFLPDADEIEAYERESFKIAPIKVGEAVKRVFPNVKDGQPTLTQLMGCPSKPREAESEKTAAGLEEPATEDEGAKELGTDECARNDQDDDDEDGGDFDCEDIDYVQESESVDNHSTVVWRHGKQEQATGIALDSIAPASLWGALTKNRKGEAQNLDDSSDSAAMSSTQAFSSSWDALFAPNDGQTDKLDEDDEGLDHLFGLFEASLTSVASSQAKKGLSPDGNISMSMLSQEAQDMASTLCAEIATNGSKAISLERACPNWKENIAFAFYQKGKNELTEALENVKNRRLQMLERKRKMLEAWERQDMALGVFETALSKSLDRTHADLFNNGFLTALSQENGDTTSSREHGKDAQAPAISPGQSSEAHRTVTNGELLQSPISVERGLAL